LLGCEGIAALDTLENQGFHPFPSVRALNPWPANIES